MLMRACRLCSGLIAAYLLALGAAALLCWATTRYGRAGAATAVSVEPESAVRAAAERSGENRVGEAVARRCPDDTRLAQAFAPALALAPDDQAPRPVELLLDRAQIVYRDGDHVAAESRVDAARLAALRGQPEAYLKLPPAVDDRQAQRRLYEEAVAADRAGRYAVTAYARVHCAATTAGLGDRTVIQYWLFYLYNDHLNVHEGDWELVQIVLDGARRPLYAAYAQHNSYTWRSWDEVLIDTRDTDGDGVAEEHPRVYVARGSHASYFQYAPQGYGGDQVADAHEFVIPTVKMLPDPQDEEPAFAWLRFPGHWGDIPPSSACRNCDPGPVGPVYNSNGAKWRTPLEWGGQRLTREDLIAHRTARISVQGTVRTHVYDEQGRHAGPLASGRVEVTIPGAAHLTRPGTQRTIVLLPGFSAHSIGRVEVEGGELRALSVLLPTATGADELHFPRVALGPAGRARLELGRGTPALQVDADGDGAFERQVRPLAPDPPPP